MRTSEGERKGAKEIQMRCELTRHGLVCNGGNSKGGFYYIEGRGRTECLFEDDPSGEEKDGAERDDRTPPLRLSR